jgi:hypothetical protein
MIKKSCENANFATHQDLKMEQCTEVRFASFLSGGFITAIVVNPSERKLAKRTSVQWGEIIFEE